LRMVKARSLAQRKADAIRRFESDVDCFFATTNADDHPNVVPLSVLWHSSDFVLCTRRSTQTVKNLRERPFARLIYGSTRDVVLVDAVTELVELGEVQAATLTAFHDHVGWDIAAESGRYVVIACRAETIQAWGQEPEARLMEHGAWLI
jgi:general stress protein 26